jgi:hypothetical protein
LPRGSGEFDLSRMILHSRLQAKNMESPIIRLF